MIAISELFRFPARAFFRKIRTGVLLVGALAMAGGTIKAGDEPKSVISESKYETRYQTRGKNCADKADEVADYLVRDFREATGHLFEWALKDLGLQTGKNEVVIEYKSSNYDPATNLSQGYFNIKIPGIKTFKNVRVDVVVTKTVYTSGVIKTTANIIYSDLLLKSAVASILFVPQKNNDLMLISESKMDFGWFFNMFITRKRYRNIVEWRIMRFTDNIRDECVKRKLTR